MATKISALTAASTLTGAEIVPVVQSSATVRTTLTLVSTWLFALVGALTNKSIDLASNTLTGTKALFNTALSDDNFVYIGANNVFTGTNTMTAPVIDSATGIGQVSLKHKTADESVTSSTVLQDDNHLTVAIAANVTMVGYLKVQCGDVIATTGIRSAFTFPAGATFRGDYTAVGEGISNAQTGTTTASGTANVFTAANFSGSARISLNIAIYIANGATPGNLTFQWCQDSSSGTALTLFKGGQLVLFKVS